MILVRMEDLFFSNPPDSLILHLKEEQIATKLD